MTRRGRPPNAPKGRGDQPYGREEERTLAAHVAREYYLQDRTKVAIATEVGLSRFQVARLLELARSTGMVRIEVTDPGAVDREMSSLIQQRLVLRRAVVVSSPTNLPLADIGRTLAALLSEIVDEGNTVGLSWSRALRSMVEQLDGIKPCTFVQLAGHMAPEVESIGSVELVRRAAEATDGTAYPIYAPYLVPNPEAACALATQPDIANVLSFFDNLDVAVISVGSWAPSLSIIYDELSERERRAARARGAIGDINGRLFNTVGQSPDSEFDARTIAISLEQLKATPEVICSSYGAARAEATLAAMRAGLATTWVMDQPLAQALLDLATFDDN